MNSWCSQGGAGNLGRWGSLRVEVKLEHVKEGLSGGFKGQINNLRARGCAHSFGVDRNGLKNLLEPSRGLCHCIRQDGGLIPFLSIS